MIAPVSWASLWNSALFVHLWQSTLFVVAIWLLSLALRRHAARTRYWLWMIASAKFLIPFSLLIAVGQSLHLDLGSRASTPAFSSAVAGLEEPLLYAKSATATAATTTHALAAAPTSAPAHYPLSILWILAAVWAAGAIYFLTRWTRNWWRIHRALRSSEPADLAFPFPVCVVATRMEPGVFGVFRPVLLLPRGLVDHLKPAQLNAVLAHELCHIHRRDNLWAAAHTIVEALFWFHPAVWWIEAQLLKERERACDEAVLASRTQALSYAEGILNVCKFYVEAPLNCMSGITGSDLKKRIVRIMSQHRGHPLGRGMKALLATAALVAVGLPLSFGLVGPVHAQAKPAAKANHGIVGTWQGTLHVPNHSLRTVLKVKKSPAGKLSAKFYSIDQGGQPIPVSSITFTDGALDYAIEMLDLKYTGKLSADGSSITGTVTQAGDRLPLVFERTTPETAWTLPPPPPHIPPMAATAHPTVEVATINPTKPGQRGTYYIWRGGQLVVHNLTLDGLIKIAYDVQSKQLINSPSWMSSDKFDIQAKPSIPGTPNTTQIREMVKDLLAKRFQLKTHTEHKTMSAFVLTVAKGGTKMKKDTSNAPLPGLFFGPPLITLRVRNATMSDVTNLLQSTVLDRPVVDHTGLTGHWDFSLHWTPDPTQFGGRKLPLPSGNAPAAPPLATAIRQQLGLKMGLEKTSVPVLVIDHVEHPSPN